MWVITYDSSGCTAGQDAALALLHVNCESRKMRTCGHDTKNHILCVNLSQKAWFASLVRLSALDSDCTIRRTLRLYVHGYMNSHRRAYWGAQTRFQLCGRGHFATPNRDRCDGCTCIGSLNECSACRLCPCVWLSFALHTPSESGHIQEPCRRPGLHLARKQQHGPHLAK